MPTLGSGLTLSSLLGLIGLCACGGVSRVDGPGHGNALAGSSSGGADSAGQGGDERAGNAAGGSNAAGSGNMAGASDCSQFRDDVPQSVRVTVHNATGAPLYIGPRMETCGVTPLFEVRDAANALLAQRNSCGSPCEGWLKGNPVGGCVAICMPTSVTKLAVGETITTQWSGLFAFDAQLPTECDASGLDGTVNCAVDKRVEPGSYTFSSTAGTLLNCESNPNGCPECVPNVGGGCTVTGARVAGEDISAASSVELDASYGVNGSSGGSSNDLGKKPVALIFSTSP